MRHEDSFGDRVQVRSRRRIPVLKQLAWSQTRPGRLHSASGNCTPEDERDRPVPWSVPLVPFTLARLSQLAVKHPSNGRISGGVVPQGRHHRMDGDYAIGMPSVVILGGGWSGKLILSR